MYVIIITQHLFTMTHIGSLSCTLRRVTLHAKSWSRECCTAQTAHVLTNGNTCISPSSSQKGLITLLPVDALFQSTHTTDQFIH